MHDDLYRVLLIMERGCQISDCICILADKELAEERKKLYEAIGYSENAKLATYSAEVCMQLIHDFYCIVLISLYVSVCGSSLEL